ncbi:hypothetical protein QR680_000754 [Steinernema hermaphroditum]|uniref:Uncharacterized protein n=1 Tax=Steinernema hermaphroditum TaxID=289476 RepID=A0AA39GYJ3_9BILA|nr:hypothetical protein QR680_000754 [Steinernema hermaphroditum]
MANYRQFGSSAPKVRFGNKFFQSVYWALRGCQYWLCFYDTDIEVDVEDLLANPFNTQPPSLDELQRLTGFKREWIMFLYRNFKQPVRRLTNGIHSDTVGPGHEARPQQEEADRDRQAIHKHPVEAATNLLTKCHCTTGQERFGRAE